MCIRRDKDADKVMVQDVRYFKVIERGKYLEHVAVEVWLGEGNFIIVNCFNPCQRLKLEVLETIKGPDSKRVAWCGDFNARSTL